MSDTSGARVPKVAAGSAVEVDQGLRSYMLKVYNLMGAGLVMTGLSAYALSSVATVTDAAGKVTGMTPIGEAVYQSPLAYVLLFSPLALVLFLSARVSKMSVGAAQATFWLYSILTGLSLSSVFLIYAQESITQVFFLTAATFGALSLFGYTTKRDISAWGSFLFMGLVGLILAMVVNIFLGSEAIHFAVSVIGVLLFAGLTAWDTQQIKEMYDAADGEAVAGRKAVMGALALYLDFLNMFLFLLNLFGSKD